jgi:hypothetical protein
VSILTRKSTGVTTEIAMAQHAERLPQQANAGDTWEDTPDLEELAAQQNVKPVTRFEDLLGDFWPADEDVDDFIAAVRQWRREGAGEGGS